MTTKEQKNPARGNPISIKDLLESGAHFGHQKHRWNPKMLRFIFEERNGIYIINLAKTIQQIRKAQEVLLKVVEDRGRILFVGTKKQAKVVIKECADLCGEFFVCERWLGGLLTNLTTIRQSVKTLERIEKKISAGEETLSKKELSILTKKQMKLDKNLSGIRGMRKKPAMLVVVDPSKEHIAVSEAKKLGIPVMALVDTNCNPDPIDHVIACNDDALKSIKLILLSLANAINGKKKEINVPVEEESSSKEEKKPDEKKD